MLAMAGKATKGKGRGGINPPNKRHRKAMLAAKKRNRLRNLEGCTARGARHETV
jgi:hypothetical protein